MAATRVMLPWLEPDGERIAEAVCRLLSRVLPELEVIVPPMPLAGAHARAMLARQMTEYDGPSLALAVVTEDSSMAGWVGAAVAIAGGDPATPARDGAWLVPLNGSVSRDARLDTKGVPLDEPGIRRLVADLGKLVDARPSSVLKAFDAAWPDLAAVLAEGGDPDALRRVPRHPHDAAASWPPPHSVREVLARAVLRLVPTFTLEDDAAGAPVLRTRVPTSGQELVWAVRALKEALTAAGFADAQVELHAPLRIDGGALPPVTVSFDGTLSRRYGHGTPPPWLS